MTPCSISDPSVLYKLLCETEDLTSIGKVIVQLTNNTGQLAYEDNSKGHKGQTALHVAVARGEFFVIQAILNGIQEMGLEYLFSVCATGTSLNYISLLGETPLAAALIDEIMNGETGHFSLLLAHGADITQTNSRGDTVLHSIVRVATLTDINIPERLNNMLDIDQLERCSKIRNHEHCSPLQLAFKLPAVPMIHWLIEKFNRRSVFANGNSHIEAYNITELDTVTSRIVSAAPKEDDSKRACEDWIYKRTVKAPVPSGLEMMFANNFSSDDALGMMDIKCVKFLINEKWHQERWGYFVFGILYFMSLLLITIYSMDRKDNDQLTNSTPAKDILFHNLEWEQFSLFSKTSLCLSTLISFLTIILCTTMLISRLVLRTNPISHALHNLDYTLMFLCFTVFLCLDCLVIFVKSTHDFIYNGEFLLVSIIFGWSFSTIFLRIFLSLGHLIDLIRQVIIKHILSFICITTIINISFATCFFDLLRYVEDENGKLSKNENFQSFWRTLYTMFTVTIGLSEIESIFNTRNSWFAILLFILFMVIVYLLILNFLIAVMTETCTRIFARRNEQQILHKLSSMLFIEDTFLLPLVLSPLTTLRVKGFPTAGGERYQSSNGMSAGSDSTLCTDVLMTKPTSGEHHYKPSFELCFRRNMMSMRWGKINK